MKTGTVPQHYNHKELNVGSADLCDVAIVGVFEEYLYVST